MYCNVHVCFMIQTVTQLNAHSVAGDFPGCLQLVRSLPDRSESDKSITMVVGSGTLDCKEVRHFLLKEARQLALLVKPWLHKGIGQQCIGMKHELK